MKKALLLLAALGCFSIGFADNTQAVRKTLDAKYKAISAAMKGNQIDKVAAMMTDDYVAVQTNGQQLNKTQIIGQFKGIAGQLHNMNWSRKIVSVTLKGDQAFTVVQGNFKGDMTGGDGKTHTMTQSAMTKDTWIKTAKGYMLKRSEVQKSSVSMDGHPLGQPGG